MPAALKLRPPERILPSTLQEACEQAGYGMPSQQRELCSELGISRSTWLRWTSGLKVRVRIETEKACERLAPRLHLEAYEILRLIRK